MNQSLVFTATGKDKTGIVSELTKLIWQFGCNIDDSRMGIFGDQFSIIMLISGSRSAINQLEARLPLLAHSMQLLTIIQRTQAQEMELSPNQVTVEFSGKDAPGILKEVTEFFARRDLDLISLRSKADRLTEQISSQLIFKSNEDCNWDNLQPDFNQLCERLSISGKFIHT
ncbi:glycine cleavage system protein R [Thalassotalea mangrovi]|uniref:Glycine cleavage system transcriptional repressor n=1 Tax=Thalassotalea mangrovi TaxID=2572245 RepID=A0A4U1B3K6_9GAMM|nr:ACT domain-containing protein [Thalassotalea mangrovi]TKB44361.1 transcriptional regulator [Thalassotalea mangrovi]